MNPSDVLLEARDLIADPNSWHQYASRNVEDTKHCAIGAINHITVGCNNHIHPEEALVLRQKFIEYLNQAAVPFNAATVNDHFGHEAVMEMYDQAIRMAKDEGE